MKLSIQFEMPPAAPMDQPRQVRPDSKIKVEDRVRQCLDCVESGRDSWQEWILLSNLYKSLLNTKKRSPRAENILKMIEPVMRKYGYAGVGADT